MNVNFQTVLLRLLPLLMFCNVHGQHFDQMILNLEGLNTIEKDSLITSFISSHKSLPVVERDTAIFMVRSNGSAPKILSDFNGFLNPRYIDDTSEGTLNKVPETTWYFQKKHVKADARIFYQFEINGAKFNDPLNVLLGYRFDQINSELRMPDFKIAPELISNQFIDQGAIISIKLNSTALEHERNLQIYLPSGYELNSKQYPSVYFHDGSFYAEVGRVPQILDFLIANGKIPPVIAVFDTPMVRGKEYRGDQDYIDYIKKELIPFIDSKYRTIAHSEHRAVIGGSRGGLSSLILSHSIEGFSKCGVFSPAIHPREIDDFIAFLKLAPVQPREVALVAAIYDRIWYPDAVALKGYFQQTSTSFQYKEISEGHNIQSWVAQLDFILESFFASESP